MSEPALPMFTSLDAFLAWENEQELRYEYVGGVVRAMAGGTENHDLISMNVARALGNRLSGGPCRVHGSNLKVRSPLGMSMYPDAFVRCGPGEARRTIVGDVVLVVEVLSPGTGKTDLTQKRWAYQAIETLQALLFVDPDRPHVEIATRQADGGWLSHHRIGLDSGLPLQCLGIELPLAEIYEGADLEAAAG